MIKIILAEDHNIIRKGIRKILEKDNRFDIVGEAANGVEVIDMVKGGTIPDIIIADINMPQMNGHELVEKLKETPARNAKIVFLTIADDERNILSALSNGVHGYLLKNIGTDELIFALNYVAADKRYVSAELSTRLLQRIKIAQDGLEKNHIDFSRREREVLDLIAHGYTNQEIADKLFTSRRTVEGHRQAMISKASVRNSAELIRFAVKHSLIS
ncbi:MAG: response regulator [Mucilaginibacter sp.]